LRKLEDIEVEEISLVAVPATRKQFYIIKTEGDKMDNPELEEFKTSYKSVFGEDLTEEQIAKAKELPKEALNAVKSAAKTLEKYKDDFDADLKDALKTLTKYSSYGYGYPQSAKKSDEEQNKEFIEEITDVEKAGKRFSKATREQIEKAMAILKAMLKEDDAGLQKADLDLSKFTPEQRKEIQRLQKLDSDIKKAARDAEDKKALEEFFKAKEKELQEKYGLKPKQVKKTAMDPDNPEPEPEPEPKGSEAYRKQLEKSGRKFLWPSLIGKGKEDQDAN
jgi:hypothetical protein